MHWGYLGLPGAAADEGKSCCTGVTGATWGYCRRRRIMMHWVTGATWGDLGSEFGCSRASRLQASSSPDSNILSSQHTQHKERGGDHVNVVGGLYASGQAPNNTTQIRYHMTQPKPTKLYTKAVHRSGAEPADVKSPRLLLHCAACGQTRWLTVRPNTQPAIHHAKKSVQKVTATI